VTARPAARPKIYSSRALNARAVARRSRVRGALTLCVDGRLDLAVRGGDARTQSAEQRRVGRLRSTRVLLRNVTRLASLRLLLWRLLRPVEIRRVTRAQHAHTCARTSVISRGQSVASSAVCTPHANYARAHVICRQIALGARTCRASAADANAHTCASISTRTCDR
jgi:hypothetical protein